MEVLVKFLEVANSVVTLVILVATAIGFFFRTWIS